jgi:hypothetical protein
MLGYSFLSLATGADGLSQSQERVIQNNHTGIVLLR